MRTTKGNVESAFKYLCKAMGRRVATSWNDVGAWQLNHSSIYGGYVIDEIMSAGGGIDQPFGFQRMKASEFYAAAWMTIRAVEMVNTANNRLLSTILPYLDHPEVRAINFAVSTGVLVDHIHAILGTVKE